jgi:transposase
MMLPPSGVRVWLATGATDMRRGMNGLALQVQQALQRDPHAGDLYGVVAITVAQLGYMLEGIDWRHPQRTWRPEMAG